MCIAHMVRTNAPQNNTIKVLKLTKLFTDFTNSEKTAGLVLVACTIISLMLANCSFSEQYIKFWHFTIFNKPLEFWINDGLMTLFFLLVGLEIERELYVGELSNLKKSLLPIFAAVGGMLVPALIYFYFNKGLVSQSGFGIPMATDIAFSLAVLSLLGSRVPISLKIFLTALAIIDDLGAIIVIALFYSTNFLALYFLLALLVFVIMLLLRKYKVQQLWLYLLLGAVMWFFIYRSGIHPTITGILLAFAIPFGQGQQSSVSFKLQHRLHLPVAFFILPVFALVNTAIHIQPELLSNLSSANSYGIMLGLIVGKPVGIFLFCMLGIALGLCALPEDVNKKHLFLTGLLAGIGFTMSMFITLLAFTDLQIINVSKIAVIISSVIAGLLGYVGLRLTLKNK